MKFFIVTAIIFYLQHAVNGQHCAAPKMCTFIQSRNYPHHYFGVKATNVAFITGYNNARAYNIVPGLIGRGVSFQSCAHPDKYLRHQGYILKDHKNDKSQLFKKDSSFILRKNHFFPGYYAFESVNFPSYFIRHAGYVLRINKGSSTLFKNDASFRLQLPGYKC